MEELKCRNCGATLTESGKCEYCGSKYRIESFAGMINYVEVHSSPVQTLECAVMIPQKMAERMPEEALGECVEREMAHKMAASLGALIKYQKDYDPFVNAVMIRGKIRVVPPDFRF